ncbi:MAG: FkbM family methyltransferase [Planctomycetota bacterium]
MNSHVRPWWMARSQAVVPRDDLVQLGSEAGAWIVPLSLIGPESVVMCFGVGGDASFDLALIERTGCRVHAFDPTPRARSFGQQTAEEHPAFVFHEVGLWSSDTELEFFEPAREGHVSYSATNLQGTSKSVRCPVKRLSTLMGELGVDRVDLLKIDVEGAEYEGLSGMLDDGIRPGVLGVEFDQPVPMRQTRKMLDRLRGEGYAVVAIRGWNYTLVRDDASRVASEPEGQA